MPHPHIRPAQRPLIGPPLRGFEIALGANRSGAPVASLRPSPVSNSGALALTDPEKVRELIEALEHAHAYLIEHEEATGW